MKDHNAMRCSACQKKKFSKSNEVKRILKPELFNNNNNKKEETSKPNFQCFRNYSEALLQLLQLYNKEYEKNIK